MTARVAQHVNRKFYEKGAAFQYFSPWNSHQDLLKYDEITLHNKMAPNVIYRVSFIKLLFPCKNGLSCHHFSITNYD